MTLYSRKISAYILVFALLCCAIYLPAAAAPLNAIISPINKNAAYDLTSISPGAVLDFPLTAEMFAWEAGSGVVGEAVTPTQLRQSNIMLRHDIAQPRIIDRVTLATTTFNGRTTACVRVTFAKTLVSVNSREFRLTLWLSVGSSRDRDGEITLNGTFANEEVTVSSGDDFVSLAGGKVLVADASISKLEIDIGGAQIFANVTNGRRYYAAAMEGFEDEDEEMLAAHEEIEEVVRLETVSLTTSGDCVSLRDFGNYHAYDAAGEYLGKTDKLLPYSDIYYLAGAELNPADSPNKKEDAGNQAASPLADTPEEKAAKAEMEAAAEKAADSGSGTANVHVKDVDAIAAAELTAMFETAAKKEIKARYTADTTTMGGTVVQGRIEINPALAVKLNKDILLGVHTNYAQTYRTAAIFKRYYENGTRIVHLSHEGSYGMTVDISAKIETDGMDEENLRLYVYSSQDNSIKPLHSKSTYFDNSGYIHFTTIYGGDIIVSDGALHRR